MKGKLGFGSYCNGVAAILVIAAMVGYAVMSSDGEAAPASIYLVAVAGLVFQAVSTTLAVNGNYLRVSGVVDVLAAVLYTLALVLMVQARMAVVVNVFANHVGVVGMPLVATAALFVAAILVKIVAGFLASAKAVNSSI